MSTPLVTYGDVEQALLDHLTARLAGHPLAAGLQTGTQIPDSPDVFLLVRRAGGLRERYLDRPRLDVQVWHCTDVDAHDLADLVSGLIWQAEGVGPIRGVTDATGPVYVPDSDRGASRYLLTVTLTVKGAPA